jgi:outer membrane receptor protein involved in Fe transport
MKRQILFILLLITTLGFAQQKGTVTGTITDKDMNNETLPFASVSIKGSGIGENTDENGKYSLEVPAGSHVLVIAFMGYESVEVPFTIAAGETKTINRSLTSGSVTMEEVVIQATVNREKETALLAEQKNAVEIKQSIGAQEIARKGISDVEEGLTKITGISKVESRGLFVRGLESRYNNLLINDFAVPSNSPFNKIIPLDLFPTDIVGYMDVFKTFNPDIYGDFAGATVNIHTGQGGDGKTKITIGTGYTTRNNLNDFLIASDANDFGNYIGFPGSGRDLPSVFGNTPRGAEVGGSQASALESGFNADETKSPLNTSFGVTHMNKFTVGKNQNTINYIFSTNYDNKYTIRQGADRTFFTESSGLYDNNLRRTQYRFQTSASTLLGAQFKSDRTKLNFNALYIKATDNLIQEQVGYTGGAVQNFNQYIRLNQYEESGYFNGQLFGTYDITADQKHSVRAGVSFSNTEYSQPDRKFITGNLVGDNQVSLTYGGNNFLRQFLNVDGNQFISGLAEYNYKFGADEAGTTKHKVSVGYNGFVGNFETSYRFVFGRPYGSVPFFTTDINNIDNDLNRDLADNLFRYSEESTGEWNTKLQQSTHAGYANVLYKFSEKFELNAGVRAEMVNRDLKYRPISASFDSPFLKQPLDKTYILPSLNSKYMITDRANLRFAASKTITQPVLFETLPFTYVNADGTSERGNAALLNSENLNADLKFEFYPSQKELLAATVFAKHIKDPIERVVQLNATGGGQLITYVNNESAVLGGVELEALIQMNRVNEALEGLSFGFNTSLMYTEATADKNRADGVGYGDTFDKRNLQGASNWLVNSDFKYDVDFSENWINTLSLVYSVYGKRIYAVGVSGYDHIYEMPFSKLDFVWTSTISEKWNVRFSADNILDPTYRLELGDESKIQLLENSRVLKDFKRGVGFSMSLSYTF